jgi:hypothetical protein
MMTGGVASGATHLLGVPGANVVDKQARVEWI